MAAMHSNGVYGRFLLHRRFTKAFSGYRVNKEGRFVYVKYHFICDQGSEQFTRREAIETCGEPQSLLIHSKS